MILYPDSPGLCLLCEAFPTREASLGNDHLLRPSRLSQWAAKE